MKFERFGLGILKGMTVTVLHLFRHASVTQYPDQCLNVSRRLRGNELVWSRERCTGCGTCVDICPVNALTMDGEFPVIDEDWCVGCGVCALQCPAEAAKIKPRSDRAGQSLPADFVELHGRILKEKGLSD